MDGCMDHAHAVWAQYELPQHIKDELIVLELSVTWAQS